jgi:hypothetical protein
MPAEYSLYGKYISETYPRVLQVTSGDTLLDGSGDTRSIYVSGNLSADTIFSASTNLGSIFSPIATTLQVQTNGRVIDGSSTSRALYVQNTFSADSLFIGSSNLFDLFAPLGGGASGSTTIVRNGINTFTGGTVLAPTINITGGSFSSIVVSGNTALNIVTASTLQANVIRSGNTDLYSIFLTANDGNDITRVQPGTNVNTGGTANNPIISIVNNPSFNNITLSGTGTAIIFSATTLSAGTITSGSTDLYNIFATTDTNTITRVQPGSNVTTGGTDDNPVVNVVDSPHFNDLYSSGVTYVTSIDVGTISADTLISGSTNLYNIFSTTDTNTITRVQPGSNITTGGTPDNPVINIIDSPSFNNISVSGTANINQVVATAVSANTIYGDSQNPFLILSNSSGTRLAYTSGNYFLIGSSDATFALSNTNRLSFDSNYTRIQNAGLIVDNITAVTVSGGVIKSGGTDLYNIFLTTNDGNDITRVQPGTNINTGGTANNPTVSLVDSPFVNNLNASGTGRFVSLSSTTLSGGTITSGSTDLYNIFATIGNVGGASTYVQPGTNTTTGGSANAPTVNVVDSPSFNNITLSGTGRAAVFSATTFSANTITSGSTDLYNIFATLGNVGGASTYVQPGSNIITGGSANAPIISIVSSPSLSGLTLSGTGRASVFTADTIGSPLLQSGATDLSSVFAHAGKIGVTSVGSQNLNITTGGTDINPTIILAASPNLNGLVLSGSGISSRALSFSATTLSGATLYSGSTDLSSVFAHSGKIGVTSVGSQNLNITTGGTDINPTIILASSPNLAGVVLSGSGISARALSFSATTLSGATIFSASTDLSSVFAHAGKIGVTSVGSQNPNLVTGGTDVNPTIILASSPSLAGLILSGSGISARALSFSATTLSGATLYSGSTDLSSVFAHAGKIGVTSVGSQNPNITTGGTDINPTIILASSPNLAGLILSGSGISARALSFSATTLSGGTLYSGSTDISSLFAYPSQIVDPSAQGNIQTGGTATAPIFSVVDNPSFAGLTLSGSGISARALSFSATTLSGSTLYSGSTDLSSLFAYPSQIVDPSAQGNIQTGGTATAPIFSVVDNPSFNGITLSGSGISARALSFSATTLSGGTLFSGSTNLYSIFAPLGTVGTTYVQPGTNTTTGGTASTPIINVVDSPSFNNVTLSGTGLAATFSATTLSGGTLISGSTNLYNIFQVIGGATAGATTVQPGSNITTGGTASAPIVSVVDNPFLNNITLSGVGRSVQFSATTLSGGTLYSGSTDLSSLFAHTGKIGVTSVGAGNLNITTGGTDTNPTILLAASPNLTGVILTGSGISARALSFSATTLSGGTLYSGSTDISSLFAYPSQIVDPSAQGNIQTGGTSSAPIFSVVDNPAFNGITLSGSGISARALSFSATTLSGGTLYSGSTDLSTVFAHAGKIGVTSVGAGHLNITTGGTDTNPTILLAASPSLSGVILTGSGISARALSFSATTLSGATLYSGSTDISSLFAYPSQIVDPSAQGNIQTGGTATAPIFSVVDNPNFNGIILSGSGIASRALSFSATTLSGATLYSGSTDISSLFAYPSQIVDPSAQGNIQTGGTATAPIFSVVDNPAFNGITLSGSGIASRALSFSATTLSGATLYSGSTDLSTVFAHAGKIGVTSVGAGNLNITTGGTDTNPTILLAASPSLTGLILSGSGISARALSFSATTLSGGTLYSGSTDISSLFAYPSQIIDPIPQGNIQTGGTAASPIFSVVDSPSFNGIVLSGSGVSARAVSFSATTLSGNTLFSGSTNLYSIFAPIGGAGITAGQSVGLGNAIFKQVNGSTIEIRSLSAGTNITITTGDTITISAAAGTGSFSITETEIDFGTTPVRTKKFTVTDAAITAASKIMVTSSGNIATSRVGDDWEWDSINFTAKAGSGQFTLTAFASGRVRGARKIFYTIA